MYLSCNQIDQIWPSQPNSITSGTGSFFYSVARLCDKRLGCMDCTENYLTHHSPYPKLIVKEGFFVPSITSPFVFFSLGKWRCMTHKIKHGLCIMRFFLRWCVFFWAIHSCEKKKTLINQVLPSPLYLFYHSISLLPCPFLKMCLEVENEKKC